MSDVANTARRVGMMLAVGKILATRVDRGKGRKIMTAQVRLPETGEILDDVPIMTGYGMTSRPRPGADCKLAFVGGNRAAGVIIAMGDGRFDIGVASGEVALHTHDGSLVHVKVGGEIALKAVTRISVETAVLEVKGDVRVSGDVTAGTVSLRHHKHPENGAGGGTTSEPNP